MPAEELYKIVEDEIAKYAVDGTNTKGYLIRNDTAKVMGVVGLGTFQEKRLVTLGLFVRLVGNVIIIEKDINSDPLHEALIQAGVPRSQIILAYAGEVAEIEN